MNKRIVCQNRKAYFEYEVIETLQAGIVLTGTEIKSVNQHKVSLDGAYAVVANKQVTLLNCNIEPYKQGNSFNHEPKRQRRLLLNKSEIANFAEKSKTKGLTLVPLSMYLIENGKAKIELAVCRGKQIHDKRESLRKKEEEKRMKREF
jgi:SsrA-binding protein